MRSGRWEPHRGGRGDVVSIEIIRRQDGRAVDEFVADLSDADLVPLLLSEIAEVDGVSVDTVHPVSAGVTDQRLDAYETAASILEARAPHDVLSALASRTRHELDASWVAIIDGEDHMVIASAGHPPAAPGWPRTSAGLVASPPKEAMAILPGSTWRRGTSPWSWAGPRGRSGPGTAPGSAPWPALADARWVDLSERDSRLSHPSHTG